MASSDYSGLPLAWLTAELERWKAAHSALANAASYEIASAGSSRKLTRVDLAMVRQTMRDLQVEIDRQNNVSQPRCSYADCSGINLR